MRFFKRHYPLIIASIMALVYLLLSIGSKSSSANTTSVDYSTLLNSDAAFFRFFFVAMLSIIIGLILLVVIMSRFARLFRSKRKVKQPVFRQFLSDFFALVLTLGLLAFSGLMFVAILFVVEDSYSHRDSIQVNESVYNLAYMNTYDDLGYGSYVLFECDAEGNNCHRVLREYKGAEYNSNGKLNYDPTSNTITIIHHGEPIATYDITTGN